MTLRVEGLHFAFGAGPPILRDVSLTAAAGEVVALFGRSGCGKTTLLRLLAGLLTPTESERFERPARVAMVFQRPTLLPHRTALENAAFGRECAGLAPSKGARALLTRMGLEGALHKRPAALSEGMKQRVNLARALLVEPDLLLLDEPFAALDAIRRRETGRELLDSIGADERAAILVSHSADEIAALADRVVVLGAEPCTTVRELTLERPRPRDRDARFFAEVARIETALDEAR